MPVRRAVHSSIRLRVQRAATTEGRRRPSVGGNGYGSSFFACIPDGGAAVRPAPFSLPHTLLHVEPAAQSCVSRFVAFDFARGGPAAHDRAAGAAPRRTPTVHPPLGQSMLHALSPWH